MMRPVNKFITYLQEKGLKVAFAESMTCGMASEKLARYKGTADVFAGSVVCYTPEVKSKVLKVPQSVIDKYTCESQQVTEVLARNLSKVINADVHAAITGLASDAGSETKSKPVGTVFFSIYYKGRVYNKRLRFYGTGTMVREKACLALYDFILSKVTG